MLWLGPSPQLPLQLSSSYVAHVPGTYTMVARDEDNGCTSQVERQVADRQQYPVVNNPDEPAPYVLDCGMKEVKIWPLVGANTAYSYSWLPVPGATVSGIQSKTLTTNLTGRHEVFVSDDGNGCVSQGYVHVVTGSLTAGVAADKTRGFAPMKVNFTNLSASTLDNNGIHSVWSFGNGSTTSSSAAAVAVSSEYSQPGTYTATVFSSKGECLDTAKIVIQVELPSRIEVPNIFTPNADGVNDEFFLRAVNLTSITIKIVDRWGNTAFTSHSENGNVLWNGNNAENKPAAAGVYFYTILAAGADGVQHELKGNITLVR